MTVRDLNAGSRWFYPFIIVAITIALLAGQVRGEEPETVVGAFVVWGKSSGAVKEIKAAGLGFKVPCKIDNCFVTGAAAVGEGKPRDEDAPTVNFSSGVLGVQFYLPVGLKVEPFIGLEYFRRTAYVSVEALGGLDVIEVDHGPAVIFGTDIPAGLWPVTLQAKYEWGRKPPEVESGGLCAGWGPIEGCARRSNVQGQHIDTFRLIGKYEFGGEWPWSNR